jgi:hypothetical protein
MPFFESFTGGSMKLRNWSSTYLGVPEGEDFPRVHAFGCQPLLGLEVSRDSALGFKLALALTDPEISHACGMELIESRERQWNSQNAVF